MYKLTLVPYPSPLRPNKKTPATIRNCTRNRKTIRRDLVKILRYPMRERYYERTIEHWKPERDQRPEYENRFIHQKEKKKQKLLRRKRKIINHSFEIL